MKFLSSARVFLCRTIYFSFFILHFSFLSAQTFDFSGSKKVAEGVIRVTPDMRYSSDVGYGGTRLYEP